MFQLDLENISKTILQELNLNATNIVSDLSLNSPRAVGDAVQEYLAEKGLPKILKEYGINVNDEFGRRAMEDMAFKDSNNNYYAVDVKTHNIETAFNMPNLISVKRLATFYRNDSKNNFCILLVSYTIKNTQIQYESCIFKRIESFDWDCLTLGALGWGQIQIANANNLKFTPTTDRKQWMSALCNNISLFFDSEINKIGERKLWFNSMKKYWEEL